MDDPKQPTQANAESSGIVLGDELALRALVAYRALVGPEAPPAFVWAAAPSTLDAPRPCLACGQPTHVLLGPFETEPSLCLGCFTANPSKWTAEALLELTKGQPDGRWEPAEVVELPGSALGEGWPS